MTYRSNTRKPPRATPLQLSYAASSAAFAADDADRLATSLMSDVYRESKLRGEPGAGPAYEKARKDADAAEKASIAASRYYNELGESFRSDQGSYGQKAAYAARLASAAFARAEKSSVGKFATELAINHAKAALASAAASARTASIAAALAAEESGDPAMWELAAAAWKDVADQVELGTLDLRTHDAAYDAVIAASRDGGPSSLAAATNPGKRPVRHGAYTRKNPDYIYDRGPVGPWIQKLLRSYAPDSDPVDGESSDPEVVAAIAAHRSAESYLKIMAGRMEETVYLWRQRKIDNDEYYRVNREFDDARRERDASKRALAAARASFSERKRKEASFALSAGPGQLRMFSSSNPAKRRLMR